MHGIARRVSAMIVFSHPEVALSDARESPLPVLVRDQIGGFLLQADDPAVQGPELAVVESLRPGAD